MSSRAAFQKLPVVCLRSDRRFHLDGQGPAFRASKRLRAFPGSFRPGPPTLRCPHRACGRWSQPRGKAAGVEACGKAGHTWASEDRMRSAPPTSRYLGESERPEAPLSWPLKCQRRAAKDERPPAGCACAASVQRGHWGRWRGRALFPSAAPHPRTPGSLLASSGLGRLTSGSLARHAPSSGTTTRPPPRGTDTGGRQGPKRGAYPTWARAPESTQPGRTRPLVAREPSR